MADGYGQQGSGFDPDVREWSPELRRRASIGIFAMTAVLAILGTIFYFAAPSTAGWVLIVAIVLLAILLLVEVAIVATGIATEDNTGPAWLRASSAQAATAGRTAPPSGYGASATQTTEIDLRCPQCQELFTVQDTGERPLEIDCPHCGAHGQVDLPEDHAHAHAHADPGAQTQAGATTSRREDPFGDIDEVTDIEGVGPVYGEQLEDRGIATTRDLWHADPSELAEALDVSPNVTERWHAQAELMAVSGIGPQYAELLVRSGVKTIEALSQRSPDGLVSTIQAKLDNLDVNIQGNQVTEGRARQWINQAREHLGKPRLGEAGYGSLADEPLEDTLDEEQGDLPSISLKCPACDTQFEVEDDGDRPLKTTCPGCGKSGKLK